MLPGFRYLHKFVEFMMNCFCGVVTDKRRLALFLAGTIVRDPLHCESPSRREQDLNLRRA